MNKIEAVLNGPAAPASPTQPKSGPETGREFRQLLEELGRDSGL